jgi:hypothetical protein
LSVVPAWKSAVPSLHRLVAETSRQPKSRTNTHATEIANLEFKHTTNAFISLRNIYLCCRDMGPVFMTVEYVYVWDRKSSKPVAVWYVNGPEVKPGKEPRSCREHLKKLVRQYPEPKYIVEGGHSEENDGLKAVNELMRLKEIESEEEEEEE